MTCHIFFADQIRRMMKPLFSLLVIPVLFLAGCTHHANRPEMTVSHIECSKNGYLSFDVLIRNEGDTPWVIDSWNAVVRERNFTLLLDQGTAVERPTGVSYSHPLTVRPGDFCVERCCYKLDCTKGVRRATIRVKDRPEIGTSFVFDVPADFERTNRDFEKSTW